MTVIVLPDMSSLAHLLSSLLKRFKLTAEFKLLDSRATLPTVAHDGDVGYDLRSVEDCVLKPGVTRVGTGVALASCSRRCFPHVEGRSSLADAGVFPVGGVIDPVYIDGEIKVLLCNVGKRAISLPAGSKIAQLVFYKHAMPAAVKPVIASARGSDGFGSTGG